MTISVLIPSRGRAELLRNSIQSLYSNARYPDKLEVLVKVDSCDRDLENYYSISNLKIIESPRGEGYRELHLMVNLLASYAHGDWLMLFNDDALVTTKDWDSFVYKYNHVEPAVLNFNNLGCPNLFPVISRKLYELLGHFSLSAHCDTYIDFIAKKSGINNFIPENKIEHIRETLDDQTRNESAAAYKYTSPLFFQSEVQNKIDINVQKILKYMKDNYGV